MMSSSATDTGCGAAPRTEPARGGAAAGTGRRRRAPCAWLRRRLTAVTVVVLLVQMAAAMVTTAVQQTPTIDEPVYAGTAVVYAQQHDLRYNPEHPPLGKLIIAGGLVLARPHLDPGFTGNQSALGRELLYGSGDDPGRLLLWARLPVIALTLLTGLVVFAFARDLTGSAGGLVALALYTFSPDVVAHGSLATLDLATAAFLLLTVWLLWRARRRPRLLSLAGAALGAALATKMSVLAAVPVLLCLVVVTLWSARRPSPGLRDRARVLGLGLLAAAGVALIAVAVVWAAYLAVDPRLRWTTPASVPHVRGTRGLIAHWLPFPRPYRDGLRIQFGFEYGEWEGFLLGRHYHGALWYYLPVALLIKTPLGALALWTAGSLALLAVPRLRPAAPYVLVPPVVLLAAAMPGARDLGVRYALFVPVFLAVAAAGTAAVRPRWTRAAALVLVLYAAVSSALTFPFYLPYSNEAFGGTPRTHLVLHDSNVDWGQDLGRLAEHLRRCCPGQRVWLVYKGSGVPSFYGIRWADPREAPPGSVHGLLVVSDSAAAKAEGRLAALLRTSRRVDEVGHSIGIYRRP
ncbi:phospholipid carrier-dependent glycosyltransferase [Streptomyces sp. NPDC059785]|uniref:phospholipid carrier-dependent glycosyltransferase n=1 Tax=Streptomyces sp. NPDC059785 TaxID=3346945 RepID=UPI00365FA3E4